MKIRFPKKIFTFYFHFKYVSRTIERYVVAAVSKLLTFHIRWDFIILHFCFRKRRSFLIFFLMLDCISLVNNSFRASRIEKKGRALCIRYITKDGMKEDRPKGELLDRRIVSAVRPPDSYGCRVPMLSSLYSSYFIQLFILTLFFWINILCSK